MGTKESISYKMISHGPWYRQREKERGEATATREENKRESNSQVKGEKERSIREIKGRGWVEIEGESM